MLKNMGIRYMASLTRISNQICGFVTNWPNYLGIGLFTIPSSFSASSLPFVTKFSVYFSWQRIIDDINIEIRIKIMDDRKEIPGQCLMMVKQKTLYLPVFFLCIIVTFNLGYHVWSSHECIKMNLHGAFVEMWSLNRYHTLNLIQLDVRHTIRWKL